MKPIANADGQIVERVCRSIESGEEYDRIALASSVEVVQSDSGAVDEMLGE